MNPETSPTTTALIELDRAAKTYRDSRDLVAKRITELDEELRALYRRRMPGIKSAIVAAKDAQDAAAATVQKFPTMFTRPRTMVLHGIKLGFGKGKGKIEWDCEDDVLVERIEKLFKDDPDTRELLIITEKKPSKDALKNLEAKLLAKLGAEIEAVGDYVIVADAASDGKKLMKRILKEGAVHEVEQPVAA